MPPPDQLLIFAILGGAVGLFVWGRWRFDIVALMALFACVAGGLVDPDRAFAGFGHPAVVTVAAVLIVSRALQVSGLIDLIADRVAALSASPRIQLASLCLMGAFLSGFMNNVGALALLMPIAIAAARRAGFPVSQSLMPLSFAAILGGLVTLIGTPPNLIVSGFRAEALGQGFSMFDFAPVGATLAVVGVGVTLALAPFLIPKDRRGRAEDGALFEIRDYITELRVGAACPLIGKTVVGLERDSEHQIAVLGLIRGERRLFNRLRLERIQENDIVMLKGATDALDELIETNANLTPVGAEDVAAHVKESELVFREVVVMPGTRLDGYRDAPRRLRRLFDVHLIAIGRAGEHSAARLHEIRLTAGDVLLLEGTEDSLADAIARTGVLPLASREIGLRGRRPWLPFAIFAAAIVLTALGPYGAAASLALAALAMVLARVLPLRDAYEALDLPVLVLLAAMIPVGGALQTTGGTETIAQAILSQASAASPYLLLALVLIVTMTLSDAMNNAATAVVMSPVALAIANGLAVSPDPFLMAVAVGASAAFLTPIGHQNNTLVMGPGGYRFGDYWRLGLPLELVLVAVAVPLIPAVFPFQPA